MCSRVPLMVGNHSVMQQIGTLIGRVAPSGANVLVLGESGTGKEIVARLLHAQSLRAAGPFVAVNCGAIPSELLESELFGHERGAFTGATTVRAGLFQVAAGGTIFLDEIGELSSAMQVKLLRVLQDNEIRPVGSDRTLHVDVRVIAATNRDLAAAVAEGRFREDLYYRLNVVPIEIPPLRERRSDVPLLVEHALERVQSKSTVGAITISEEALALLWEYDWPGNVRELENLVERLVVLADDPVIEPQDLPVAVRTFFSRKRLAKISLPDAGIDLTRAVTEYETRLIEEALRRARGSKVGAARLLGIGRTTLITKLCRRGGSTAAEPIAIAACG